MNTVELISLIFVGLASGALGGLLGIGGSIIMIPVLTILFNRNIHLAEAAAMIVNVFVAIPSTFQHARAKAVDWKSAAIMLPFGVVFIVIGVITGNAMEGYILEGVFGAFLVYVVINNIHRMVTRALSEPDETVHDEWWRVGTIGSIIGFAAGLLGIGGGTLTVPLLQRLCNFPIRRGIATSSAVMILTAVVGAIWKNATLDTHEGVSLTIAESLLIAACLAPTAFIGSLIGARLTHVLPLRVVRIIFLVLIAIAAVRMLWSAFEGG